MTETPEPTDRHDDSANGASGFIKAAEHALPIPRSLLARWPIFAVLATVLAGIAGLGHVVGGLGEFARLFGEVPGPHSVASPLTVAVSNSETRSFDGYDLNVSFQLPKELQNGPLLAGGGHTRLVLQAKPSHVVEISRLSLEVTALHTNVKLASLYTIDPTRQPGFGAARPRTFQLTFDAAAEGTAFYINGRGEPEETSLTNLLNVKEFSLLRLDDKDGLQETIDVNLFPRSAGFFAIHFHIYYTSDGENHEQATGPIYLVRK